jgi:ribosomal protein S18 acetylase RimI-like enzyme
VEFWNTSFKNHRNFFPVDEQILRQRIIEKKTDLESFDPRGMILAFDEQRILGMVHAGIQSEMFCKACEPGWQGGTRGYIGFIFVRPEFRKRGIGSRLWKAALEYLKECQKVIIDGQCLNPFYGNSEGPFTPWWGTTEGISISWNDQETKSFFARRGFSPRFKAFSLEWQLEGQTESEPPPRKDKWQPQLRRRFYPLLDRPAMMSLPQPEELDFYSLIILADNVVRGYLIAYRMTEVSKAKYAIYEVRISKQYQGQGMGMLLVNSWLEVVKQIGGESCEVTTVPELSPGALEMYRKCGFEVAAEWAIY